MNECSVHIPAIQVSPDRPLSQNSGSVIWLLQSGRW